MESLILLVDLWAGGGILVTLQGGKVTLDLISSALREACTDQAAGAERCPLRETKVALRACGLGWALPPGGQMADL